MRFTGQLPACLIGTVAALVVTVPIIAAQKDLTKEQIDDMSSRTTVVIAQGLQKGDIEARQEWNPGSGVIVARSGNVYYVLTALHVVRTREVVYGVRTADGEVHFVDDVETQDNIHFFGKEDENLGETIEGFDLAIVKFKSDKNYPVAVIGKSQKMEKGEAIYISGWPNPEEETARRERKFSAGNLTTIVNPPSGDGGYSMLYDNQTRRGMSGGPVFNSRGELIGIHGRGRAQDNVYCIDPKLSVENSCGIQSLHFLSEVQLAKIPLTFKQPPVDLREIEKLPVDDVIENIYEEFTFDKAALLRDGPSGGCESLLLGDPCP